MKALLLTASFLLACSRCRAFQSSPAVRRSRPSLILGDCIGTSHRSINSSSRPSLLQRSSSSSDDEAAGSDFDVSEGDADDTILRINFSFPASTSDDNNGSLALAAVQDYTKSFPFAAVLPVQPLTYLPEKMPGGQPAVKVSFLRKKTAEKGSMDGGILFSSCLVSEEDCEEDGSLENYKKSIQLTAWRITKGQTVSKIFSEKQIVLAFVKGLSEGKGKELLDSGKVEVDSVFHIWM